MYVCIYICIHIHIYIYCRASQKRRAHCQTDTQTFAKVKSMVTVHSIISSEQTLAHFHLKHAIMSSSHHVATTYCNNPLQQQIYVDHACTRNSPWYHRHSTLQQPTATTQCNNPLHSTDTRRSCVHLKLAMMSSSLHVAGR